jgi:hypothetical protein
MHFPLIKKVAFSKEGDACVYSGHHERPFRAS